MNAPVLLYYLGASPAAAKARAAELRADGARVLIRDATLFDATQVEACARVECLDEAARARVAEHYGDLVVTRDGAEAEPRKERKRK